MELCIRGVGIGSGSPKICAVVLGKDMEEVLSNSKKALESGADLLEWRADTLEVYEYDSKYHNEVLEEIRAIVSEFPIIYTFRTLEEGGKEISNEDYKDLVLSVAGAGVADLIDIEIFSFKLKAREIIDEIHSFTSVKVIGSYHDFKGTPDTAELVYRLSVIDNCNSDILKIATYPRKKKDVMRMMTATILTYTRPNPKPIISISMGEMGKISRVVCSFTGSVISFASLGKESAEGQFDVRSLRKAIDEMDRILK